MPRARGTGSILHVKGTKNLSIKYYWAGKGIVEPTHSPNEKKAEKLLRQRLAAIDNGTYTGPNAERARVDELADDFLRDYRINNRKSIDDAEARWRIHLQPFFGRFKAVHVGTELIARYVDQRQREGAKNATINRELACLKRMFRLGRDATPPKVNRVPKIPRLAENNIRTGFLDDEAADKLMQAVPELWFKTLVELGRSFAWRRSELLGLKVKQLDFLADRPTIRLEPGTTKNKGGRNVVMTALAKELLLKCVVNKSPDDYVLTRDDGKRVKDFRETWHNACVKVGLGRFVCRHCGSTLDAKDCELCKAEGRPREEPKYEGLIVHDLRRTGARNLRRSGVAETVIKKIGGWKTNSVFERYNIVDDRDLADATKQLEKQRELRKAALRLREAEQGENGRSSDIVVDNPVTLHTQ